VPGPISVPGRARPSLIRTLRVAPRRRNRRGSAERARRSRSDCGASLV